jgi:hypothetical protein
VYGEPVGELESEDPGQEIAGALADFVSALRTGAVPMGQVHQNIMSLAMVESAVLSASSGKRIMVDALLEDSYARCLAAERNPDVLQILQSWPTVRAALAVEPSRLPQ